MKTEQNSLIRLWRTDHETYKIHQPVKKREEITVQLQPCTYIIFISPRMYKSSCIADLSEKKNKQRTPPKSGNLSTTPTHFYLSQKVCFYFNLLTIATLSQWSVTSDPRMAVVKWFHCKYLCEGRDVFGSSLKQTGNSAQTDHKISIGLNASSISSLPPQSISLLSNLMLLTGSLITKLPGSWYLPAEKKSL